MYTSLVGVPPLRRENPGMAAFVNPVADAAEAHEGLRELAHTTRTFEDPVDTYRVLGEVSGAYREWT